MTTTCSFLIAAMLVVTGTAWAEVRIDPQDSGVKVRLRGISAVSADVAWASGREGTVLRTVDGGKHWQAINVPEAGELDFRDVEGFDAETAVVLSIGPGEASRVYQTGDGGKTWQLTLQNKDPRAFFDCMVFDGQSGWLLGDPVDGRFQVYATKNGGKRWKLIKEGPAASAGEAAFAASGSCIASNGEGLFVVTGGGTARDTSEVLGLPIENGGSAASVHVRKKASGDWKRVAAYLDSSGASFGFFSIAVSRNRPVIVGGDYKLEKEPGLFFELGEGLVYFTHKERVVEGAERRDSHTTTRPWRASDGGSTLEPQLSPKAAPRGYRSGVACMDDDIPCISAGPSGVDAWNGRKWSAISDIGYDAIDLAGNVGWASGDAGRIARIEVSDDPVD